MAFSQHLPGHKTIAVH